MAARVALGTGRAPAPRIPPAAVRVATSRSGPRRQAAGSWRYPADLTRSRVVLRRLLTTVSTTPEEGIRPRQSCACVMRHHEPPTGSAPCLVWAGADSARQA